MPTYAQNKVHIKTYTDSNKEFVREITRTWKLEHKEQYKLSNQKYYQYHKEAKRFMNILLD